MRRPQRRPCACAHRPKRQHDRERRRGEARDERQPDGGRDAGLSEERAPRIQARVRCRRAPADSRTPAAACPPVRRRPAAGRRRGEHGRPRDRAPPARPVAARPREGHFVYRRSHSAVIRVIHDGCGSGSCRPSSALVGSAGCRGNSSKCLRSAAESLARVEHREVAHLAMVLRLRLRRRVEQEVGDDHRAFLVRGVVGNRDKTRVADRPLGEDEGAHRVGQQAGVDRHRGLGRVERDHHVDLAVVQELPLRRAVVGELRAPAPQLGLQRVVPGPQRGGRRGKIRVGRRLLQHRRVRRELVERLLQERRAEEVAHRRMREAPGMTPRPVEKLGNRSRGPQRRARRS